MTDCQPLSIDLKKDNTHFTLYPNQAFNRVYQTQLSGKALLHGGHGCPCEYQEHSYQQHCIAVHLKPKRNSQRRLGDLVKVEHPKIGDTVIIPSSLNHWQRIESKVSEAIVLAIEPETLAHFARNTISPDRIELLPTFARPDPLIYGIALNLKHNLDSDRYDRLYAESLFYTLFLHLLKNYSTRKLEPQTFAEGLSPYKLKQVLELINDNLAEEVTIAQMAECIDLSSAHFAREFKRSTGFTPHQYVVKQRLERVKQLLKEQKMPLLAIAHEYGFTHQSHMGKIFKQHFGVTPKGYRDEVGTMKLF